MKWTKTLKGRITGITGIIVGLYLLYLGNKFGALVVSLGIGFLLWRFKR